MKHPEHFLGSVRFLATRVGDGIELHIDGVGSKILVPTDKLSLKGLGEFLMEQATVAELPVPEATDEPDGNVAAVVKGVHKVSPRTTSSMLDDDPAGGLVSPRQYTTPTTGGYGNN